MTRKLVGQVTPEEKNEIQSLFERRNGLNELAKVLTADNAELYDGTPWQRNINGKAPQTAIGRSISTPAKYSLMPSENRHSANRGSLGNLTL